MPHSTSSIHFTALSYTDRGAFILSVLLLKRLKTVGTRLFLAYVPRYPDTAPAPPIPFSLYNISFDSYIKPQLLVSFVMMAARCISFDSYIKPQQKLYRIYRRLVVYLLIPTSNHNSVINNDRGKRLYIF